MSTNRPWRGARSAMPRDIIWQLSALIGMEQGGRRIQALYQAYKGALSGSHSTTVCAFVCAEMFVCPQRPVHQSLCNDESSFSRLLENWHCVCIFFFVCVCHRKKKKCAFVSHRSGGLVVVSWWKEKTCTRWWLACCLGLHYKGVILYTNLNISSNCLPKKYGITPVVAWHIFQATLVNLENSQWDKQTHGKYPCGWRVTSSGRSLISLIGLQIIRPPEQLSNQNKKWLDDYFDSWNWTFKNVCAGMDRFRDSLGP